MIRFSIILATIPLLTLGGGWALRPAPPAQAVQVEGVRAQRADADTFRYRYAPTADMPLTVETKYEPLLLVDAEEKPTVQTVQTVRTVQPQRSNRSTRVVHSYSICTRHGMRKVMVGRYKWRCRR